MKFTVFYRWRVLAVALNCSYKFTSHLRRPFGTVIPGPGDTLPSLIEPCS